MSRSSKHPGVHVTQRPDSRWAAQSEGATRAAGIFPTQRAAEQRGRQILDGRGGGELVTHDREGQIRSKDTIARRDPFPPRDREH